MKRIALLTLPVLLGFLALSGTAPAQEGPDPAPSAPTAELPGLVQPEADPTQPTPNPNNTVDHGPRWGIWRGEIQLPGAKALSFNFVIEFTRDADKLPVWDVTLRNGPEILPVNFENNHPALVMTFPGTKARIEATLNASGTGMSGEYIYTRDEVEHRLPYTAYCSDGRRFAWIDPAWTPGDPIAERWSVTFDERQGPAIAELRTLPDGETVTGTVMTPQGDDGLLVGTFESGRLRLSRFTGGSGLLYDATLEADGTMIGTFRSLAHHAEGFTAAADGSAQLPDLFGLTKWRRDVGLADMTFRTFEGSEISLAELAPDGSPRLIYIMGTWCHNCADATRYLGELHNRYASEGLTIVGLAFETPTEFTEQAENVRSYVLHRNVPFPILVAGQRDKDAATQALGALDKVRAFPTIAFVSPAGEVVAVHQGFVGPAAPERHAELRAQFESRIEAMLTQE